MAKRITGSTINWERIAVAHKHDVPGYMAFKAKYDKHLKRVMEKKPDSPKIDWAYYKSRIAIPSFVDSFQKSYESFQIPYPSDQGTFAKLEKQEKELYARYQKDIENLNQVIAGLEKKLEKLNKEIPYSEMSMEEFFLARPDLAINPDKPQLWPTTISDEALSTGNFKA